MADPLARVAGAGSRRHSESGGDACPVDADEERRPHVPLLPDLPEVPKDDAPEPDPRLVPDTPITDPERRDSDQATGEEQAEDNRQTENPT